MAPVAQWMPAKMPADPWRQYHDQWNSVHQHCHAANLAAHNTQIMPLHKSTTDNHERLQQGSGTRHIVACLREEIKLQVFLQSFGNTRHQRVKQSQI